MSLGNIVKSFLDRLLSGNGTIDAVVNNQLQQQPSAHTAQVSNDPVEQHIRQQGYVWQPRLWRRHVMAQMFKMLHGKRGLPISEENYDACLARRSCNYTWQMLADELRAQALLSHDDTEQFAERNRWFNSAVVEAMARDLAAQGIGAAGAVLSNLAIAHDPDALLAALKPMEWVYVYNYPKCPAWIDAYKGVGAYFTMKNLILFHNCQIHLDDGQVLDRDASMQHLSQLNANTAINGQQMFATMLRLISDNNFDWQE